MTREEAKAYIIRHCNPNYPKGETEWEQAVNMAIKALEQPTIEPQRTGKWIRNPDDTAGSGYFICSECKTDFYDVWKYCPNCGAKMEIPK